MPRKISVALGGGGVRGYAHIGVLRQLISEGYEIVSIAGTSAGGIIGSLFACGYSPDDIEHFVDEMKLKNMFGRENGDPPSVLGLRGIKKIVNEKLGDKTFIDLNIPFACTAVDLNSGSEIILNCGKLTDAVQATIALPGIFPSKIISGLNLVDGGIFDPVPVSTARWLAPNVPVIAICLTPEQDKWINLPQIKLPTNMPIPSQLLETVLQLRVGKAAMIFANSIDIMTNMITELKLTVDRPDLILRPDIQNYALFDDIDPRDLIERGKQIVIEEKNQIELIFRTTKKIGRWLKPTQLPGKLLSDYSTNNISPTLDKYK